MTPRNLNCVTRSTGVLFILMLGTSWFFVYGEKSSFLFLQHSGTVYLLLTSLLF